MKRFPQVERGESVTISIEFDHHLGHLQYFDEEITGALFVLEKSTLCLGLGAP